MSGGPLPADIYLQVVASAPLVAIDLIVRDAEGRVLVGLRRNEPARDTWFVPGGAVRKNETLDAAFARITAAELGRSSARRDARLLGVYEHFYARNFMLAPGISTHYVVLAHELAPDLPATLPQEQHGDYRWMTPFELREHPQVHENTRAYFRAA
ncbi:MAG: GDP-mannose mannosyl hydrolase [Pseudomonadota bacterium]|nr:GDP-mannose mannosyl hydrolase [Pseudomonadota bacterium]